MYTLVTSWPYHTEAIERCEKSVKQIVEERMQALEKRMQTLEELIKAIAQKQGVGERLTASGEWYRSLSFALYS